MPPPPRSTHSGSTGRHTVMPPHPPAAGAYTRSQGTAHHPRGGKGVGMQKGRCNSGGSGSVKGLATRTVQSEASRTNLIIRRIHRGVNEEVLTEVFRIFGRIASRAIMRNIHTGESLGTAFVRFETSEEAKAALQFFHELERFTGAAGRRSVPANGAVEVMDGEPQGEGVLARMRMSRDTDLAGFAAVLESTPAFQEDHFRDASVQWARKQHDNTPDSNLRYCIRKLFIRNIPCSLTRETLQAYFSSFGRVQSVSIHKDTPAAAAAMIAPLPTTAAANATKASSEESVVPGSDKCTTDEGSVGPRTETISVASVSERRIAFVTFDEDGAAERAANGVHNTKPFPGCDGIPLMVKLAEDTSASSAQQGVCHSSSSSQQAAKSGDDVLRGGVGGVGGGVSAPHTVRCGMGSCGGGDITAHPRTRKASAQLWTNFRPAPLALPRRFCGLSALDSCKATPLSISVNASGGSNHSILTGHQAGGFFTEKNVSPFSQYDDAGSNGHESPSLELSHLSNVCCVGVVSSSTHQLPVPRSGRAPLIPLPDSARIVTEGLQAARLEGEGKNWLMPMRPTPPAALAGFDEPVCGRRLMYVHNPYSLTSPRLYFNGPAMSPPVGLCGPRRAA